MKSLPLLSFFLFSSVLFAQKTLQEARVEENLFILKIIGVVVLFLIAMPFMLRRLKAAPSVQNRNQSETGGEPAAEEIRGTSKPEVHETVQKPVDPVEKALDELLDKHNVAQEKREELTPLYRRYVELKMGRVEIKTGSFDFNNVLDKVMARVHALENSRNFELIFDIESNVPSKIIGDAERMEDVLFYIVQNVVLKSSVYLVKVKITRQELGDGALHLQFTIAYDHDNYMAERVDIFTPFVGGGTVSGLELFLAKSYAKLMHGDVTFELEGQNDSVFVVSLKLFMPNPSEMRHYRLPSKTMIGHAVLIVDDHSESALAVKKMFEYFKNEVDVLSSKELFSALEMLDDYDIVVLQERYFSRHLIAKLDEIKSQRTLKAVSLNRNEGFEHTDAETIAVLDGEISKPVTVQKVFDLLISLYKEKL